MPKPDRGTLDEVARRAKVSRATASRALRNHPAIPVETRERVQEVARRLGYRINPLVSRVMANVRTARGEGFMGVLGFITAYPTREGWREVITFQRFFAGASERASQLGYRLEEFWVKEPGMTGRRMSGVLQTRGVAGLLIAPLPMVPPRGHLSLDWPRFAAVALGRSLWRPRLDRVAADSLCGVRKALRELRHSGYRRVGLAIPSYVDERADDSFLSTFLIQQRRFRASDFPLLLTREWSKAVFTRWFRAHRPEAVISIGHDPLIWLRDLGCKIPEQVGYVELDLRDHSGDCAGIDQNSEAIGAAAVDSVVAQLQRSERGLPTQPKLVLVEGTWVNGATLGRPALSLAS